jgi:hypothetical protein
MLPAHFIIIKCTKQAFALSISALFMIIGNDTQIPCAHRKKHHQIWRNALIFVVFFTNSSFLLLICYKCLTKRGMCCIMTMVSRKPLKQPPLPIIYLAKRPLRFLARTFLHMSIFGMSFRVYMYQILKSLLFFRNISSAIRQTLFHDGLRL